MKILKTGEKKNKSHKFKCIECGCEFVAEEGEFSITTTYGSGLFTTTYTTNCPFCNKTVFDRKYL